VVAVSVVLALPGQVLTQTAGSNIAREYGGLFLTLVARVTIVLILLSDLRSEQLERDAITQRIGSATLRTIGSALILALSLGLVFGVATLVVLSALHAPASIGLVEALALLVSVWFAPLGLVVPVCLTEKGGPFWALGRAWALSRPLRGQMRLTIGGLSVIGFAATAVGLITGSAVASVAVAPILLVTAVLADGLLAVFYYGLTANTTAALAQTA
jgi:hypothetical protein